MQLIAFRNVTQWLGLLEDISFWAAISCVMSCVLPSFLSFFLATVKMQLINKRHSSWTASGINLFFKQLYSTGLDYRIALLQYSFLFISVFNQKAICVNTVHVLTSKQLIMTSLCLSWKMTEKEVEDLNERADVQLWIDGLPVSAETVLAYLGRSLLAGLTQDGRLWHSWRILVDNKCEASDIRNIVKD